MQGPGPQTSTECSCNLPARTGCTLQRLITRSTSNAERGPVEALAQHVALKRLRQALKLEPNHFPCLHHFIVPVVHQAALFGGHMWDANKDHVNSKAVPLQEMRLFWMHRGFPTINKFMLSSIFQIWIWFSSHNAHARFPLWDSWRAQGATIRNLLINQKMQQTLLLKEATQVSVQHSERNHWILS